MLYVYADRGFHKELKKIKKYFCEGLGEFTERVGEFTRQAKDVL